MINGNKDGFERVEGGEIVKVRNRNKVWKGQKIKFKTKIKGRKKAKWSKRRAE